tara:strand:+ start:277 stop:510 length:234 start_codon:yes stop_codon:yes gene_type:complete
MKDYSILIHKFYNYVSDFYSKKYGIYPIASEAVIQLSVNRYLETTPLRKIEFDSVDREKVKDIIEKYISIGKTLTTK